MANVVIQKKLTKIFSHTLGKRLQENRKDQLQSVANTVHWHCLVIQKDEIVFDREVAEVRIVVSLRC